MQTAGTVMPTTKLGKPVALKIGLEEAVAKLRGVLEGQGFAVVGTLDVKEAIKAKAGVDVRPFLSMGVVHYDLLKRIVSEKPEAALWLPWSIAIEWVDDKARITVPDPMAMTMFVAEDAAWREIAGDLKLRFERVLVSMGDFIAN